MNDLDPNSVTLKVYVERRFHDLETLIDTRFDAQEKATKASLIAAEKAVLKAEGLATTRAEQQNEWRATVTDLTSLLMPRQEYQQAHAALVDKIGSVDDRVTRVESEKTGIARVVPWLIAAAGGIVAIISLLIDFTH